MRFWPDAGIGVALAASGLVDVAPDSPKHLTDFDARGLPGEAVFTSPGGEGHRHHLYRRPDGCPTTRICRSGEYDILSDGYAILPNGDGSRVWQVDAPSLNGSLPDAPPWVVEELKQHAAAKAAKRDQQASDEIGDVADEPPVDLNADALATWRGERPKRKPDGDVDRSASLVAIGRVLYNAGAMRRVIVAEIRARDHTLGWHKYCERADAATRYNEIVNELEASGRNPRVVFGSARAAAAGNGTSATNPAAASTHTGSDGAITLGDFLALPEQDRHVYRPTRGYWVGSAVNKVLPPQWTGQIKLKLDANGKATEVKEMISPAAWLAQHQREESVTWMPGQQCRFVLTSTNVRALQDLVGEVPVHELIGKPYDLDALIGAVRRAIGEDRSAPNPTA